MGPPRLTWSDDQREVRIAIPVVEGPRLRVGTIHVEGATLVSPERDPGRAAAHRPGATGTRAVADEGLRAIDRLYQRRGAFGTEVTLETAARRRSRST